MRHETKFINNHPVRLLALLPNDYRERERLTHKRMDYEKMQTGQKVFYTGDMANAPAYGTIIKVNPPNKFYDISFDIELISETTNKKQLQKCVLPVQFAPSAGRRFWPLEEYELDRQTKINEFNTLANKLKNN